MSTFTVEVPSELPRPLIRLGAPEGQILPIELEHFTITEFCQGLGLENAEGHIHLFIDGKRQETLFGPEVWLSGLQPGEHRIEVYLNSSVDHRYFTSNGELIKAETVVTVH